MANLVRYLAHYTYISNNASYYFSFFSFSLPWILVSSYVTKHMSLTFLGLILSINKWGDCKGPLYFSHLVISEVSAVLLKQDLFSSVFEMLVIIGFAMDMNRGRRPLMKTLEIWGPTMKKSRES